MAMAGARKDSKPAMIAVLLPAYNAEAYIEKAVESLLAQTYPHFEVFVIDDGSSDTTASLVEGIDDPRVRLIRNERNMGLIATLNRGLDLIGEDGRYDLIARMDADDVSLPERFAKQVAFLEAHPDIGLCSTGMTLTGSESGRLVYPESALAARYAPLGMISRLGHPSVMMRAGIFADGSVRYEKDYPHAEDTRLWAVLAHDGVAIASINEPLFLYHIHGGNVSVLKADAQRATASRVQVEEFEFFLGRDLQEHEKAYVDHRFGVGEFGNYLGFHKEVLGRIKAREPAFTKDKECQRLVARMLTRTVLMNLRRLSLRQVMVMVRELVVGGLGLSWPYALWLVGRSVIVAKAMGLRNGL